jgi:hypothetical protein
VLLRVLLLLLLPHPLLLQELLIVLLEQRLEDIRARQQPAAAAAPTKATTGALAHSLVRVQPPYVGETQHASILACKPIRMIRIP